MGYMLHVAMIAIYQYYTTSPVPINELVVPISKGKRRSQKCNNYRSTADVVTSADKHASLHFFFCVLRAFAQWL